MLTLLATLTASAGLVLAALAVYVARRRGTRMGWSLAVVLVAVAWWGTAYALELSADDVDVKGTWGDLKYVGVVTLAPAWLVFVLQYTGRERWVTRRLVALLAVPAVLAMSVLALPATHDLVRYYSDLSRADELPIVETGPAFWVIFGYNNLVLVGATVLFVVSLVRLAQTYRRMALVLLASAVLPWAANLLHNLEVGWFARIDLTPFAFTVTAGLLVWGLLEDRLADLAPLARSAVVESMVDAVFVLDAFGRVVDVNPAAAAVTGMTRAQLLGRSRDDLVAMPWVAEAGADGVVLDDPDGVRRTFDVERGPLRDGSGRVAGELLVLRDVTQRVRDQQHLQQVLDDRSRVAATLQASMVPTRLPDVPGYDLGMRFVPAGDGREIGGDFLDVFALDDVTWAFMVGDVSGKGAEAAAVSAATRYALRALARPDVAPAATLEEVHGVLRSQTGPERHCTVVFGHLRAAHDGSVPTTPHVTLSLAGHHWPVVVRADGSAEDVGVLGTALALLDEVEVSDADLALGAGDVLCVVTDGVLEARRGKEQFGAERVAGLLRERRGASADQLAGAVLDAVRDFHGDELADDLAVLVVAVPPGLTPPGGPPPPAPR